MFYDAQKVNRVRHVCLKNVYLLDSRKSNNVIQSIGTLIQSHTKNTKTERKLEGKTQE